MQTTQSGRIIPPGEVQAHGTMIPVGYGFGFDKTNGQVQMHAPFWLFSILLIFVLLIGYFLGRAVLKKRTARKLYQQANDTESFMKFRRHETTITLTYMLVLMGFVLFVAGATGTITVEIPGAKLVTSLPGIILIYFGYRLWAVERD